VKNANLESFISIRHDDFFKTSKSNNDFLQIIFNPPYGERLEINMEALYEDIGNTLKRNYSNSTAWFITSNMEALKFVGLRPSRKIKLFNAKLESVFAKYELYDGSKKAKKNL
jgi:putative N6-adenine-specific DNA methylase